MPQAIDLLMEEALRFMLLPAEERVRLAEEAARTGATTPPPWLDDDVMNALAERGYTQKANRSKKPGDMLSIRDGKVCPIEVSKAGQEFLAARRVS